MRSLLRWSVCALVFCVSIAHAGPNTWSPRGPYGGGVRNIVVDPLNGSIVYAAVWGVLYKSTDAGVSWTELPHNFGASGISDLLLDPSNSSRLYIASYDRGLLVMTDGGANVASVTAPPTDVNQNAPAHLAISTDGETIYYSALGSRIYRSTDGGATFVDRNLPVQPLALAIDPIDSEILYVASFSGLHKTSNGGDSWNPLPHPEPPDTAVQSVVMMPGAPNTLWIATFRNVYSTTNDGQNWTPAPIALADRRIHQDPKYPTILYTTHFWGENAPIHRYQGGAWQALPNFRDGGGSLAISPGNPSSLLLSGRLGVWRSTNGASTWSRSNEGLIASDLRAVAQGGGVLYAGTTHGELVRAAGDTQFQPVNVSPGFLPSRRNLDISALAVHPSDPNIVIAGLNGGGLMTSHDGGDQWTSGPANLSETIVDAITFDPSNPTTVYAWVPASNNVMTSTLLRSQNAGLTFTEVVNDLPVGVRFQRLAVDPQDSNTLFGSSGWSSNSGTSGLYRSLDAGTSWIKVHDNFGTFDVTIDDADTGRVYALANSSMLISDDGGDSFRTTVVAQSPSANPFAIVLDPELTSVLYVLVAESGNSNYYVMRSVDRAQSWERMPSPVQSGGWVPSKLIINSAQPTILVAASARGMHTYEVAPNLAVELREQAGSWPVAAAASFNVVARNHGPLAATQVRLEISTTGDATFDAVTVDHAGSCSASGSTAVCTLPFLKADDFATARVSYTTAAAGSVQIAASASARETDTDLTSNSDSISGAVSETADLIVTGASSATSAAVGSSFAYSFRVRNDGPNTSSSTRVQIQVAPIARVNSASPTSCTVQVTLIDCDLQALASGAESLITVNVTPTGVGPVTASATAAVASSSVEADPANNAVTVEVLATAALPSGGSSNGGGGGGGGGAASIGLLMTLCTLLTFARAQRRRREVVV